MREHDRIDSLLGDEGGHALKVELVCDNRKVRLILLNLQEGKTY